VKLSKVYQVTPRGRLETSTTLRLPLNRRIPRGYVVVAATAKSKGAPWLPLIAKPSGDGKYVTVSVTHLSIFSVFGISVKRALAWLKKNVLDGIDGGFTAEAQPPHCQNEAQARTNGYSIASNSKDTVFWCFGVENGQRVLRVVNNRRYPLAVTHPGLTVIKAGSLDLELAQLSRAVSGNETIISPRDEVVFGADLTSGGTGAIHTEFDGVGQSLYQLEVGVSVAVDMLTHFGASGHATLTALKTLLKSKDCASAIGGSSGEVIEKCFTPGQIKEAFGYAGLLVAPIMAAGPILNFFRSEFNSVFDQVNHRDEYRVVIRRAAASSPPPPPATTTQASPPPSTSTSSGTSNELGVGSTFDDDCSVAWPTAPTRTSQYIEMTMECAHLPHQYMLAVVVYPDPNFNVTPSTGRMHIHGRVVDIAKSAYGFSELVVQADRIDAH
jgi:hypothetical protein